jgi:hypothetical protein
MQFYRILAAYESLQHRLYPCSNPRALCQTCLPLAHPSCQGGWYKGGSQEDRNSTLVRSPSRRCSLFSVPIPLLASAFILLRELDRVLVLVADLALALAQLRVPDLALALAQIRVPDPALVLAQLVPVLDRVLLLVLDRVDCSECRTEYYSKRWN